MKIDLKNKKTNIIVSAVVLAVAFVVALVMGFHFASFSAFVAYFNTDRVDETQKFSRYSSTLEGTAGDADIFVMIGSENTVALVKKDAQADFDTPEKIAAARVTGVRGTAQLSAAQSTLAGTDILQVSSSDEAVGAVKAGTADVAVLSYAQAKAAVTADETLAISAAEVEKVPSLLLLGGTHPNEPSGQLAATVFLENAEVERGKLYVITETNRSAYTHSMPQEASTWYYDLTTKNGKTRTFKFGARPTNTNQQWPNPDVYVHSSGQNLSATEVRNINRAYPGSATGNYTERVAYAIAELIRENDITMVVDLHEAAPEYITINAMVAHQDSMDLATIAKVLYLDGYSEVTQKGDSRTEAGDFVDGINISLEQSPVTLHGLTHRELGDYTNAYVFLCETSNASQGKLRGSFNEDLITYERPDKFYEYAAGISGLLYARPVSINERVGRHVQSVLSIVSAFNEECYTRNTLSAGSVNKLSDDQKRAGVYVGKFRWGNVPEYVNLLDDGVGYYLADPQ